jgi:hypothetical protein
MESSPRLDQVIGNYLRDADPLQDAENLRKISRRFKQGAFLAS